MYAIRSYYDLTSPVENVFKIDGSRLDAQLILTNPAISKSVAIKIFLFDLVFMIVFFSWMNTTLQKYGNIEGDVS